MIFYTIVPIDELATILASDTTILTKDPRLDLSGRFAVLKWSGSQKPDILRAHPSFMSNEIDILMRTRDWSRLPSGKKGPDKRTEPDPSTWVGRCWIQMRDGH